MQFKTANKINGFKHISYRMAVKRLTSFLAASALLAACAISSLADTEGPLTTSTPVPATLTDWSNALSFPQFNPSLGTLISVELDLSNSFSTTLTIHNMAGTASSGTANTELQVTVLDPGNYISTDVPADVPELNSLSPGFAYSLAPGASISSGLLSKTGTFSDTFTQAAILSEFTGVGNISLSASTLTRTLLGNSGGNTTVAQVTDASLTGDVIYTYVTLVVGKSGPSGVLATSNVVYTITVTNTGASTASGVTVTDALPAAVTYVSATGGGTTNGNAGVVTWSVGTLAAGQGTSFVVTNVAPANAPAGGSVTNVAVGWLGTNSVTSPPVVTVVTNVADVAVTNVGPGSVLAGMVYTNVITVTNLGPSTASNVVVVDNGPGGVLLSNVVAVLPAGGVTNFLVVETAPGSGPVTNTATASPATFDPNLLNNTNAAVTAVTPGPVADVQVLLFGPATNTVGDGFFYTIVVSNGGPSTAVNTLVTNLLPTNLVFVSASDGGVFSNGVVIWPVFPSLTNGQATNLVLTVSPVAGVVTNLPTPNPFNFIVSNSTPTVGFVTNRASAFAATFDPNLTNNSASAAYTNAQVQTLIVPGVFSVLVATNTYPTNGFQGIITNTIIPIGSDLFIVGTSAWNPVTQLYEEFVSVTNIGPWAVHALRLYIGGLRSGVTLYDATGTNGGVPYVEYDPPYDSPLNPYPAPNNNVTFVLELYSANGQPFTNSLTVVPILAPPTQSVSGNPVTNISINIIDARGPNERFLIQFPSIPGRTYTIEYSDDDMATWNIAVPSIIASATFTLWYDNGPPETLSLPSSRFYRVILQP